MKLKNIVIGCVVILVIVCIVGGAVAYFGGKAVINTFGAPITASNDFMAALIAKDYAKAYGLVATDAQSKFGGSADGLQQYITTNGFQPASYTFSNFQLTDSTSIVNDTGSFGGISKYVYINMIKEGDNWKVENLDVNDNAPTATPNTTPAS